MPKSILYLGGFELPDKNAAAQRVIANGKLFTSIGYQVFYLGVDREVLPAVGLMETARIVNGFQSWSVNYPQSIPDWFNYLSNISSVQEIIEKHLSSAPFAIIAYDYPSFALARLKSYCKKNGIALIADSTEWYVVSGGLLFRILKATDTILRMRWLQPRLDGLIAVSRYLYEYYAKRMKNVLLLPPLVDLTDEKWQFEEESQSSCCRLIYSGSPGSGGKDRIDKIIKALAVLKDTTPCNFSLAVVGITEKQYMENFGQDSLPDTLREQVKFFGRIPHKEAIQAVKRSDYSIFIRDDTRVSRAGFPTKFVESISCGTPVLTNATSNISEYLNVGENGYILDVTTEQSLIDSLFRALSLSREEMSAMRQECLKVRAFDYLTYKNESQRFLDQVDGSLPQGSHQ